MKLTVVAELHLKSQKVELAKRNFAEQPAFHGLRVWRHIRWIRDQDSWSSGTCLNNGGQKISTKTVEKNQGRIQEFFKGGVVHYCSNL